MPMTKLFGVIVICLFAGCAQILPRTGYGVAPVLTQAAETACKGQAAANVATDAALLLGQKDIGAAGAVLSGALGVACKW